MCIICYYLIQCSRHSCNFISVDRIESDKFRIGNKYDSDNDFIRAVIKVQQGHEENLSNDKAKAIAPWNLDPESGEDTLNKPISEFEMMKQAQEKANKRKSAVVSPKSAYDPAIKECVGGSAAEVEHVWSMAGHVSTDHCSKMSPLIFELVMYLKYDSRLWGITDVVEANKRRKNESAAAQFRLSIQKKRLDRRRRSCTFGIR